ncbi:MAG: preprotein translocase subunit SecY [Candidatus Moranbacteria bacterium]|nr:preprotein translocase subunit SecY [Candidatus Moranbacteria bacterium]
MMHALRQIWVVPELREKILFILAMLVIYRFAANIPLPGVDVLALRELFEGNQLLGLLNLFSGGGLSNISVVLLGVAPYITASIIMQLMTMISPQLEKLYKEEGEAGRQKFNMWTRWLTVPLAFIQAFGMISLLRSQNVLGDLSPFMMIAMIATAVGGTVFLMWIGELITEKGLGNGVSIMIFAGIIAGLPTAFSRFFSTWDASQVFSYIVFFAIAIITIAGVVLVNDGQRIIPISYAKRLRGSRVYGGASTHLPLRVNQAGVIPIIFAVSIILIPSMVANYLSQSGAGKIADVAVSVNAFLQDPWVYAGLYFVLVAVFTYFYTAVIFDPYKISENLQKQGGFIPGIRPGTATAEYLGRIINRITLAGAVFLGSVAVLPVIVQNVTNIQALTLGGVSVLIVVSVVLEMMKQMQGQLSMRNYDGF